MHYLQLLCYIFTDNEKNIIGNMIYVNEEHVWIMIVLAELF